MKKMAIILPRSTTLKTAKTMAKMFNMHILKKEGRMMITHLPPGHGWESLEQLNTTRH